PPASTPHRRAPPAPPHALLLLVGGEWIAGRRRLIGVIDLGFDSGLGLGRDRRLGGLGRGCLGDGRFRRGLACLGSRRRSGTGGWRGRGPGRGPCRGGCYPPFRCL